MDVLGFWFPVDAPGQGVETIDGRGFVTPRASARDEGVMPMDGTRADALAAAVLLPHPERREEIGHDTERQPRCSDRLPRRWAALIASALLASSAVAAGGDAAALSCVPAEGCGCAITVAGRDCPAGSAHFFHALADGAPLRFDAGQGLVTAPSLRAPDAAFSHGPGEVWAERYRYDGGRVEILYSPAPETCAKVAQGERCEYFDVRARVRLLGSGDTRSHVGQGTCGC